MFFFKDSFWVVLRDPSDLATARAVIKAAAESAFVAELPCIIERVSICRKVKSLLIFSYNVSKEVEMIKIPVK